MLALFLIALVTVTAIAAGSVLADSGLRWWSAFGRLRRELVSGTAARSVPELRHATGIGFDSYRHCEARSHRLVRIKRAA